MAQNRDGSPQPAADGSERPTLRSRPPGPSPSLPAVPPQRAHRPRPQDRPPDQRRPDQLSQPPLAAPSYSVHAPAPPLHSPTGAPPPPLTQPQPAAEPTPPGSLSLWERVAKNWTIWSLVSLTAVGGVGILSAVSLLRIPNLPNCRAIFWPTASATTRIQCAQAYAEQGTVEGYLEAIKLVEKLPDDHPLRSEINQRVEDWASRILDIAEDTFQAGDLDQAIKIANDIPKQTAAAGLVSDRVSSWKQIWETAESIYAAAEADLKNRKFPDAFTKAIQLLSVGNRYWETTQYEALTGLITAAREDLNKLGRARNLARRGGLENFREALKLATSIQSESPMHGEAQALIKDFGRQMLEMAEAALERKDTETATNILKEIPAQANLAPEIADFRTLSDAYQLAWQGGTSGLEGAIVRLQSISQDRPLYAKAQSLMARWQLEIEGRSRLSWAQQMAQPGMISDLEAAIAEAERISRDNPVWSEAKAQIDDWQAEIATSQDQPYLNQAEQLAAGGDLSRAIEAAEQVRPGRPLYNSAQALIDQWQGQLERSEDGPLLAQARALAAAGRYQEAVATAAQIGSSRSLYDDAQAEIERWRGQMQGQQRLQSAYQAAEGGTLDALVAAIGMAREVPEGSPQYSEAQQALNRWSWDLLRLAETEAPYSLSRAIEIARRVPSRTEAYAAAQLKIQQWQSSN